MSQKDIYNRIPTNNKENQIKRAIFENSPIEEKLHVIAVIFNPTLLKLSDNPLELTREYEIRYKLFKEFQERMEDEPDVILYVVEMVYGDQEFLVTNQENARHLQLRTTTPLWHRENMINLGIKQLLPSDWKAVAWIDADIEFDSHSWAKDTLKILNGTCDLIHLYSHCNFIIDEIAGENPYGRYLFSSFGFNHSKGYKYRKPHPEEYLQYWHSGFATACTRRVYDSGVCLNDTIPFGYSERFIFACLNDEAFQSTIDEFTNYKHELTELRSMCLENEIRIGYVPGTITHHFHGKINHLNVFDLHHFIHNTSKLYNIFVYDNHGIQIPKLDVAKEFITKVDTYIQENNKKKIILYSDKLDADNIGLYIEHSMVRPNPLWGPTTWMFLHTLAHWYDKPITEELLTIVEIIFRKVPCGSCREHATKYLEEHPFNMETILNKEDFVKYLFTFHNEVKEHAKNPIFEYEKMEETYSKITFDMIYPEFTEKYLNFGYTEDDRKEVDKIKLYFDYMRSGIL
jgi:hypothetical protein